MSTLTQFLQGDSFPGEVIPGTLATWGVNPTFQGREYLQTGYTKTYSSDYSGLAANFKQAVSNTPVQALDTGWSWTGGQNSNNYSAFVYSMNFIACGGNIHQVYSYITSPGSPPNVTYARWGSSLSSAPTGVAYGTPNSNDYGVVNSAYSHIFFNNSIIVSVVNQSVTAYPAFYRSTGTTYSSVFTTGLQTLARYEFAASPSLCIAVLTNASANTNTTTSGAIYTSSNGSSWTTTAANINMYGSGGIVRLTYSTAGSCFILVNSDGNIYTSTNGTTWTQRTSPTGMPSGIGWNTPTYLQTAANSSTATVITLSEASTTNYLLRTTDGVTFTLVDLMSTLQGFFNGVAGNVPRIYYDGTNFVLWRAYQSNTASFWAFSSNDGLTFQQDYYKIQTIDTTASLIAYGAMMYSSTLYWYSAYFSGGYIIGTRTMDWTGRNILGTPQVVGLSSSYTWASGSGFNTFLRIK